MLEQRVYPRRARSGATGAAQIVVKGCRRGCNGDGGARTPLAWAGQARAPSVEWAPVPHRNGTSLCVRPLGTSAPRPGEPLRSAESGGTRRSSERRRHRNRSSRSPGAATKSSRVFDPPGGVGMLIGRCGRCPRCAWTSGAARPSLRAFPPSQPLLNRAARRRRRGAMPQTSFGLGRQRLRARV